METTLTALTLIFDIRPKVLLFMLGVSSQRGSRLLLSSTYYDKNTVLHRHWRCASLVPQEFYAFAGRIPPGRKLIRPSPRSGRTRLVGPTTTSTMALTATTTCQHQVHQKNAISRRTSNNTKEETNESYQQIFESSLETFSTLW